jgi:hypothetical protein
MKNKLVLTLALVVMLTAFTGCEPEPSLPELTINERMTIVKRYNDEIFTLMTSILDDSSPSDFVEGDSILDDEEGLSCIVTAVDLDEINLFMSFDEWVADDGTEISGNMILDVEYYTSPESLNIIRTGIPASLYFDRSSVSYVASFLDDDSVDTTFVSDLEYFFCTSFIADGEILILNMYY